MLYGRPYVIPALRQTAAEEVEDSLAEYMRQTLIQKLKNAQIVPPLLSVSISEAERDLKPGDQVLIKVFGRKKWAEPRWEGPFTILISTDTAVKVEGRTTWVHKNHCKCVPRVGE